MNEWSDALWHPVRSSASMVCSTADNISCIYRSIISNTSPPLHMELWLLYFSKDIEVLKPIVSEVQQISFALSCSINVLILHFWMRESKCLHPTKLYEALLFGGPWCYQCYARRKKSPGGGGGGNLRLATL